jgi:hypothetical protein
MHRLILHKYRYKYVIERSHVHCRLVNLVSLPHLLSNIPATFSARQISRRMYNVEHIVSIRFLFKVYVLLHKTNITDTSPELSCGLNTMHV